jgi:hypothetical protein
MAKVFIEETTLSAIGDAIRSKTGKTALIDPAQMHTEIASITTGGGSDIEVEPIVLTGDCTFACAGPMSSTYIELFGDTVSTSDIYQTTSMFYNSTLTEIPFELNIRQNAAIPMDRMFEDCKNLKRVSDITISPGSYHTMAQMFSKCYNLETAPYIYNAYPSSIMQMFNNCERLRSLPDDYFSTWNFDRLKTYNYGNASYLFSWCRSLRKIPSSLFTNFDDQMATSQTNRLYSNMCYACHALDEIVKLPVGSGKLTSNAFTSAFTDCNRLKRLTFATNEDGTPKAVNWKSQTIDLSSNSEPIGFAYITSDTVTKYNSGITADKLVTDDATYQALKNDPDWYTDKIEYSRYNHDSAVETINSLPDTTSSGGTNTIKFKGAAGSLTDGGAINTLTEAEIAVATAKGWTVTFA